MENANDKIIELFERIRPMQEEFDNNIVKGINIKKSWNSIIIELEEGVWEEWNFFDIIHKHDFMVKTIIFPAIDKYMKKNNRKMLVILKDMREK